MLLLDLGVDEADELVIVVIRNFYDFGAFFHHVALFQSAFGDNVTFDGFPLFVLEVKVLAALVENA